MRKYFICKICASEVGPTQTGHSPLLFSTWLLALWVYLTMTSRWLAAPSTPALFLDFSSKNYQQWVSFYRELFL